MNKEGYTRAAKFAETETVIERSRFIGYASPSKSEDEAREFIEKIKKLHPFATHNCYAFIADNGLIARFSDDGEPQGTAGMPILEVIKNRGLVDTVVVVTRYFGGIKLGAGGLVRAYSGAAAAALNAAGEEKFVLSDILDIRFSYEKYSAFLRFTEKFTAKTLSLDFQEDVSIKLAVPSSSDFSEKLFDFFAGKVAISRLNEEFISFEDNR